MKIIASILLVSLLAFQVFLKAGLVGYYYINQSYISATLCENKAQPEMQCNGKCYLKKQIQKADDAESDNQLPNAIREMSKIQPFIELENFTAHLNHFVRLSFSENIHGYAISHSSSVFHPPAA